MKKNDRYTFKKSSSIRTKSRTNNKVSPIEPKKLNKKGIKKLNSLKNIFKNAIKGSLSNTLSPQHDDTDSGTHSLKQGVRRANNVKNVAKTAVNTKKNVKKTIKTVNNTIKNTRRTVMVAQKAISIATRVTTSIAKLAITYWPITLILVIVIILLLLVMMNAGSLGMVFSEIIDNPASAFEMGLDMLLGELGISNVSMAFPIPQGFQYYYSSPFGYRMHPVDKVIKFHGGVDIASPNGTPLVAVEPGIITTGYQEKGAGNYLKIDVGEYYWVYMHLSKYASGIQNGSMVYAGQVIGYVGDTGKSTGNHLHISKQLKDGTYVDPTAILKSLETQQVKVELVNGEYRTISLPNILNSDDIGALALKYESTGDIGAISNISGDWGGKSYGLYQIATGTGTMNDFIGWLKAKDATIYNILNTAKQKDGGYGTNFDKAWKSLAQSDPDKFYQVQHAYIYETHYLTAIAGRTELANRSKALNAVIFSTATQHGTGGAKTILSKIDFSKDDASVISQIYDERSKVKIYFKSQTASTQQSLINRFKKEKADALAMLKKEESSG